MARLKIATFNINNINKRLADGARWVGQSSWNGVAILAKGMTPVETRRELPGDPADTQSRYLEAAVYGVLVGCLYAPNGNPQPGPKFAYKLAWMHRLLAHAPAWAKIDSDGPSGRRRAS